MYIQYILSFSAFSAVHTYTDLFIFLSNLIIIDLNRRTRADLFVENHINDLESQVTLAISKAIEPDKVDNDENDGIDQNPPIKVLHTNKNDANDTKDANACSQSTSKPSKGRNKNSILDPQSRCHISCHVLLLPTRLIIALVNLQLS